MLGGAFIGIIVVAAVAAAIPARRVAKADSVFALRTD
jgi:ABC-type antimicrobial peptide transport system permease subunit